MYTILHKLLKTGPLVRLGGAGGVGIFGFVEKHVSYRKIDPPKTHDTTKLPPNWNVSGTRDSSFARRNSWPSPPCSLPETPATQSQAGQENTILDAGVEYGRVMVMNTARKITVEVPEELLEKAQHASGEGIKQTARTGLQLVEASRTYARLQELRGKVKFSRTAAMLKDDR